MANKSDEKRVKLRAIHGIDYYYYYQSSQKPCAYENSCFLIIIRFWNEQRALIITTRNKPNT